MYCISSLRANPKESNIWELYRFVFHPKAGPERDSIFDQAQDQLEYYHGAEKSSHEFMQEWETIIVSDTFLDSLDWIR
jgi:hypothetical protein